MKKKDLVFLDDPDLNAQYPSRAITRGWTTNTKSGEVSGLNYSQNPHHSEREILRNYWENNISLQRYLLRLKKNGLINECISEPQMFLKLLVKTHINLTKGLRRNKYYNGQSIEINFQEGWQERFRDENSDSIIGYTDSENKRQYLALIEEKHGKNWKNHLSYVSNIGSFMHSGIEFTVDAFMPENLLKDERQFQLSSAVLKNIWDRNFAQEKKEHPDLSSIVVLSFNPKEEINHQFNCLRVHYPNHKYIPRYLELMRSKLELMLKTKDKNLKISYLADAYQLGIRSQAFETVWNSLLMGIVNFFLKNEIQLKQVPHYNLDFKAFFLSQEKFREVFKEHINLFQK